MGKIIEACKKALLVLQQATKADTYKPAYRVLEILQDEEHNYTVHVQLIHKNLAFHAKPEEILADDKLVDQFSPRDVRTLTYLGYLGINSPKYKILAKRLIGSEKIIFALKKRGHKHIIVKTAAEILKEQEIISGMNPYDAQTIGYAAASDAHKEERVLKNKLAKKRH
jgi:hypothetical protein